MRLRVALFVDTGQYYVAESSPSKLQLFFSRDKLHVYREDACVILARSGQLLGPGNRTGQRTGARAEHATPLLLNRRWSKGPLLLGGSIYSIVVSLLSSLGSDNVTIEKPYRDRKRKDERINRWCFLFRFAVVPFS